MFIKVKIEKEYGKTSEKEIEKFEKEIKYKLPMEYRKFLLQHNGGKPEPDVYLFQGDIVIDYLYGLHSGPAYTNLRSQLYLYKDNIAKDFLPIGNDICGNLICFGICGDKKDKLFFLDHEQDFGLHQRGIYLLASSFENFLFNLIDFVD